MMFLLDFFRPIQSVLSIIAVLICGLLTPHHATAQQIWVDLFPEQSFENWQRLGKEQGEDAIKQNWKFDSDGWLTLYHPVGGGGSLVSKQDFRDYELSFFWKIKPNANNGIKYRVKKYGNQTLGVEYQLLDDEVKNGSTAPIHRTASMYALFPPGDNKVLNPAGQTNHSRIVVRGDRLEHWLNGHRVLDKITAKNDWQQAVDNSKFAPHSQFGRNRNGKLMITDHGGQIWFKDFMIKQIVPGSVSPE